jgi:hypothetical protein
MYQVKGLPKSPALNSCCISESINIFPFDFVFFGLFESKMNYSFARTYSWILTQTHICNRFSHYKMKPFWLHSDVSLMVDQKKANTVRMICHAENKQTESCNSSRVTVFGNFFGDFRQFLRFSSLFDNFWCLRQCFAIFDNFRQFVAILASFWRFSAHCLCALHWEIAKLVRNQKEYFNLVSAKTLVER